MGPISLTNCTDGDEDDMNELTKIHVNLLARVLSAIGEGPQGHLVVVGGLVPTLLSDQCDPPPAAPHAGTSDLDVVLDLLLATGHTCAYCHGLTESLNDLGLHPVMDAKGGDRRWKWQGTLDATNVEVDLLAPVLEGCTGGQPQVVANFGEDAGTEELVTLAIAHAELAHADREIVTVDVDTPYGVQPGKSIPIAGLGSWLVLKRHAFDNRGVDKDKDAYDVGWLVQCLGPDVVAERLRNSPLLARDDQREVLIEALAVLA